MTAPHREKLPNTPRRTPRALVALVAMAMTFAGCEAVTDLPRTGDDQTVRAPTSIIGRMIVETITERFNECVAPVGTIVRSWFVDASTIRVVRDDGTFDFPTSSWSYQQTGNTQGRITLNFPNGTTSVLSLTFETSNSGTIEFLETGTGGPCDPHGRSTFVLQDPPS